MSHTNIVKLQSMNSFPVLFSVLFVFFKSLFKVIYCITDALHDYQITIFQCSGVFSMFFFACSLGSTWLNTDVLADVYKVLIDHL